MSDLSFTLDWLDLREPADQTARDSALLAQATALVMPGSTVLDLGCGSGSTARAFGPPSDQVAWRFLDGDARLLEIATARHPQADAVLADLRDPGAIPLDGVGLVTASALLDLMPDHWIEGLVARLAQARLPFYAALNYDGHMAWSPALPHDDVVTAAFNRHQQSDKGLGPAAGPTATEVTQAAFEKAGYQVSTADSPWSLGPKDSALQRELLRGIANAAQEVGETTADGWHAARLAKLPEAHATIGHTDLLAWPA